MLGHSAPKLCRAYGLLSSSDLTHLTGSVSGRDFRGLSSRAIVSMSARDDEDIVRFHQGGSGDPCETQSQFWRRGRCIDRIVHSTRSTRKYRAGRQRRIHWKEGARPNRRGGCQDSRHRTSVTTGERQLRLLQRPLSGRVSEWRGLLCTARGPDPNREMASPLQCC